MLSRKDRERLAKVSHRQMERFRGGPAPAPPDAEDEVKVALRRAGGDLGRAAAILGMSRAGLEARLAFEKHRRR